MFFYFHIQLKNEHVSLRRMDVPQFLRWKTFHRGIARGMTISIPLLEFLLSDASNLEFATLVSKIKDMMKYICFCMI